MLGRLYIGRRSPRRLLVKWLGPERTYALLLWIIIKDRNNL